MKHRGEISAWSRDLDISLLEPQIQRLQSTHPNLASSFLEIKLLAGFEPRSTASSLLETYAHSRCIHTFLTPQWIFRAGMAILSSVTGESVSLDHVVTELSSCLILLDRASRRWPGAAALKTLVKSYATDKQKQRAGTGTRQLVGSAICGDAVPDSGFGEHPA